MCFNLVDADRGDPDAIKLAWIRTARDQRIAAIACHRPRHRTCSVDRSGRCRKNRSESYGRFMVIRENFSEDLCGSTTSLLGSFDGGVFRIGSFFLGRAYLT